MFVQTGSGFIHVPVCSGLDEKFSAGDAGQLMMPDPDIVRQLTSVSYALDGASATLNRVPPEHLDLSSDQAQSQWFVLYGYYFFTHTTICWHCTVSALVFVSVTSLDCLEMTGRIELGFFWHEDLLPSILHYVVKKLSYLQVV